MKEFFIADDLSGALDAAAGFHHAGQRVRIELASEGWAAADDAVVGITTETRNTRPEVAARIVATAIAHGRRRGCRLVYKKIDSTLRGPVAAELGALLRAVPEARILFAPANPRVGRTVRAGRLYVHDVPVEETEYARDPLSPATSGDLRMLLGVEGRDRVVIPDTDAEADLARAVAQMEALGAAWVGVGSGALARPVAARSVPRRPGLRPAPPRLASGPMLFVCGSAHARNREQARTLERERGVRSHVIRAGGDPGAVAAARADLQQGRAAALLADEARADSAVMLRTIAAAAAELCAGARVGRVFVTGGETAFAVCRALGIESLDFAAEIEPGLSLSYALRSGAASAWAIKPGGFGDAATWVRAGDALAAA